MFNLPETRNIGNQLWHQWYPEMVYDTHQTAAYPARIFVPPFKDPANPNIQPEMIRGINLLGDSLTQRLDREGKVGAVSRQQNDQWWNGGLRSSPAFHNQIGILTDTSDASATPVYEDPTKFPKTFPYQGVSTSEPSAFYPSPYKGGWWTLGDSCSYIESTGWAYLHTADTDRQNWLYGIYRTAHPLTWGEPEALDLYSDGSPAFAVKAGATGVTTPVRYPATGIPRSGWLLGQDVIAGQTAVADVKYGQGQVALLGISVQHRAQAHGTFKLLFNSLYAATER